MTVLIGGGWLYVQSLDVKMQRDERIFKQPFGIYLSNLFHCRTFEQLWLEVAKNLASYKSYPRLVGGTICFCYIYL